MLTKQCFFHPNKFALRGKYLDSNSSSCKQLEGNSQCRRSPTPELPARAGGAPWELTHSPSQGSANTTLFVQFLGENSSILEAKEVSGVKWLSVGLLVQWSC